MIVVYQLVLKEPMVEKTREVGENVFLSDLSDDFKVYLFYYPGAILNEDLENRLRDFGKMTGKNLFVNIGRLDDPDYENIAEQFNLEKFPAIVVTAIDKLAASPRKNFTGYAKIHNKTLLRSIDRTIECVEKLFNLFIKGKISEAMSQVKKDERDAFIASLKNVLTNTLKGTWEFLEEREIIFDLSKGTLEIKKSGG